MLKPSVKNKKSDENVPIYSTDHVY